MLTVQPKKNNYKAVKWLKYGDHPLVHLHTDMRTLESIYIVRCGDKVVTVKTGDWIITDEKHRNIVMSEEQFQYMFTEV